MSDIKKQIKYGAAISYLSLGISIVVSMVYTPWMVGIIGKSNYALYTLATSFISLFLVDFGLSASVSRYVAKYRAEGNEAKVGKLIVTIEQLYLVIDLIILVVLGVLYFFLGSLYKGLTPDEMNTFRLLYIIVVIFSVVSFPFMPLSGIINAYEKFIQLKFCDMFQKLFSVILIVVALLLGASVEFIVLANAISGLVTIVFKILIIRKNITIPLKWEKPDRQIAKGVLSFSVWITIISLAQRCVFNLAPTILGIVSTSDEIAVFGPANALEGYFFSFAAAVNGLFLATVSRHIAEKNEGRIYELMVKVGRYQLVLMGFVFVGFLCAGRDFMISWMGMDYEKAYYCALLLFLPDILLFSQQIANTTAIAKNKVKQQSFGYVGMAAVCVCLCFALSPFLGVIGTSVAIAASYFVLFAYMNVLYYRELKINIPAFFRECYMKLLIPISISGVIAYLLCGFVPFKGWFGVGVKAGIVTAVYLPIVFLSLTKEEKSMLVGRFR